MQTIVISVQTCDVELATTEPLVITIKERFQGVAPPGETNGATGSNKAASPFWTWFIENPRPLLAVKEDGIWKPRIQEI